MQKCKIRESIITHLGPGCSPATISHNFCLDSFEFRSARKSVSFGRGRVGIRPGAPAFGYYW